MNWEETVISKEERKHIKDVWFSSLPRGDDKLPRDLELEVQAEKSFKAGMVDVIDFIKKELPDFYASISEWSVWKAQVKDWGIDAGA